MTVDGPTPSPVSRRPALSGVAVLVVEDHDDSRDAVCRIMEAQGAQVSGAADGAEGLALACLNPPDVILCDLVMPRMDGFGLLRRLRQVAALRQTPVIAISGLGAESDRARTLAAGFEAHLVKPIDFDTMVRAVARVVRLVRRARSR
jgi:CheY-like chemotaxis protein